MVQATLFPSKDSTKLDGKPTNAWSVPAWVHPVNSSSWEMAFPPGDFHPTILHTRVAKALGVKMDDELEFEIKGERFKLPVTVSDKVTSDLTISWEAGIVTSSTFLSSGECMAKLSTGKEICLVDQELFASTKPLQPKGRGVLRFDGVSRNEPHTGPAGLGFCIYTMDENGRGGHVLVSGHRYLGECTSNHADYQAFIEGMTWAMRFNFEKLWIRGDAQLVVHQLSGKKRVKSSNLKQHFHKGMEQLKDAEEKGIHVTLQHVAHDKNTATDVLVNFAVDMKSTTYACNWKDVMMQLNPEKHAELEEELAKEREARREEYLAAAKEQALNATPEEKKENEEEIPPADAEE